MSEGKVIRLVNAAKEFNVGFHSIVEHLKSKGFVIEDKPTTKLTEDMYNVLSKEFQSSMAIKEKADLIAIGRTRKEAEVEKEVKEEEIYRPGRGKVEGFTLVDKIDLNPKKKEEEPVKPVEIPKKEEKPVVEKPIVKAEPEIIRHSASIPKVEIKVVAKLETPVKQEKKEEVKPKIAEEKRVIVVEKTVENIVNQDTTEPSIPEVDKVIRGEADKLSGFKIMGKIELPTKSTKPTHPQQHGGNSNDRNKRKRIAPKAVDPTVFVKPTENKDAPKPFANNNNNGPNRKPGGGFAGGGGRNNNFKGKQPVVKPVQDVVSQKEIEDKIKATMAKLGGGKTKTSKSKYKKIKREDARLNEEEEGETNILQLTEFLPVSELANLMDVSPTQVISACMGLGVFASINQRLDAEVIELVASSFGFEVEFISVSDQEEEDDEEEENEGDLVERPPIVTIMGHVDHGKTSLLDHIRSTKVVAGEMGGITQHIGAYEVELEDGSLITFLDTPGHEAFTAMRARGAKLTDIAVIVIAADDSIMPQTREAIAHAQAAGVPMIFAFNKMDKVGADADKIRNELSQMNILVEEWGGKFQTQEISAKKGTNIDLLLEKILLESEMLALKGNPNKNASGSIVEASLDKGRGYVSTVMVQDGTLRMGDFIVAGQYFGKVKAMMNERGMRIKEAGPSTPVQVLGLTGAPQAGDKLKVYKDESEAKELANRRGSILREQGIRAKKHITLDEIGRRLALGNFKELNLIIKGDVDGSVEALSDALQKISTEEVQVNIIFKGVGQISESDVLLASASDAIIIAFNVRPSVNARSLAEKEDIDIRMYSVIYAAIEEVKSAMEGLLEPTFEEKIIGNVEIREVFKISKLGTIAGCYVMDGKLERKSSIRIIRDGIVIHTGELESLKRFKDDVKEVTRMMECGLRLKNFNDIIEGDVIEVFEKVEVKRKL